MPQYIPFLRVSTKLQDTDRQLHDLTHYADRHGLTLAAPVSETVSGGKRNEDRAGLAALLKRAKRGDVILVTEISRIGRNTAQVLLMLEQLADRGVCVTIVTGQLSTLRPDGSRDPHTWAMLSMGATFGALERSLLRERVQSGVDHARAQGRIGGRPKGSAEPAAYLTKYPKVVKLLVNGYSVREIAALEKLARATVMRVRKAWAASTASDGA